MRRILLFISLLVLSACADNGGSIDYPYKDREYNSLGWPTNPTTPFKNTVVESNSKVTGMLSRTENITEDYITYRLNSWSVYNPNIGNRIPLMDIANAAAWLTDGERTVQEIEQYFGKNLTLMHMAVYVVDNRLNRCFNGAGVGAAAECFVEWRNEFPNEFSNISQEIKENTTSLNAGDAVLNAVDGAKIKFIVDDETGMIVGATLNKEGVSQSYNNRGEGGEFYNIVLKDDDFLKQSLMYNSIGKTLGLSYSDFGVYSQAESKELAENSSIQVLVATVPFAGGYSEHSIAPENIAHDVEFKGAAIGTASSGDEVVNLVGDATLGFNKETGISTLGATFDDWYDVVVKNDSSGTIEFTNYENQNNVAKFNGDIEGDFSATGAKMTVGYYASMPETGVPTEATGLVSFEEPDSGVKMNIAFGGK
ncbi:MAG TPA: hypothetical protein IAC63_00910 [Candidatus Enterousia avicola]|uniref:Lipoprotein n=1 Tax=Candidatus Enterousia avicola TaxID=2840787 RepID=A0A9D1MRJ1_9PROT|nr:hypothetical protein [Candidatus Enterousia avicola]